MASQVFKRGPVKAEMNITPLIDVVFLLIVFFMLVNKIVSDETVPMMVPLLNDPMTRELGEVERVVVNMPSRSGNRVEPGESPSARDPNAGFVQVGTTQRFDPGDLAGITAAVAAARESAEQRGAANVEVVLRADTALFYEVVRPILDAITDAGVETVHLTALLPESGAQDAVFPGGG
ncbi:MAG: biopolymer transporter ExbD [Planctomycetota bacterium]